MEEEGAVVGEEGTQAEEAALVREEGDANGREGRRVCVKERRRLAFKRIYTCGWFSVPLGILGLHWRIL